MVVTPAADQAGTATITVTVSDGTPSAPQTFTVTVTAVNDAPTLAPIANVTTPEDTATAPVSLHDRRRRDAGGGADGDGDVVERRAGAGREPRAGRDGADRTVVVTPAANQAGTATITVTVSDGTARTATDSSR